MADFKVQYGELGVFGVKKFIFDKKKYGLRGQRPLK